jgi:hypothetical protein
MHSGGHQMLLVIVSRWQHTAALVPLFSVANSEVQTAGWVMLWLVLRL